MHPRIQEIAQTVRGMKVNVNEEDILFKIIDKWRWPRQYPWGDPSIEVIDEDGRKSRDFYEDGPEGGYVDPYKCIDKYHEGKTLILGSAQWLFRDTKNISDFLNQAHQYHCNINFYFGKGTKSTSFKSHAHTYAVLVKNIYGESDWIINDQKISLGKQDVICFEYDTPHEVVQINKPKLSMTCNLGRYDSHNKI